mmetsp:Transcript_114148/g.227150  ORF Transcript_114148/g.227150 Transcript_114148/m.227150 type:complete len:215 (+) Transcript_114148:37-681(+)
MSGLSTTIAAVLGLVLIVLATRLARRYGRWNKGMLPLPVVLEVKQSEGTLVSGLGPDEAEDASDGLYKPIPCKGDDNEGEECTRSQQNMTSAVPHFISEVSTAASDLSMDSSGAYGGTSLRMTDSVSCCSEDVSTEGQGFVHPHNASLYFHNQVLALQLRKATSQLQHQQKMVQRLLKHLQKEQQRRHIVEAALLENCSCLGPVLHKCQAPAAF